MKFEHSEHILIETSLKNYWVWNTNNEFVINYISSQVDQYLDYDSDEMIGKDLYSFMTEEAKLKFREKIYGPDNKGEVFIELDVEFITRQKDKKYFHVNIVPRFDIDDNFTGFCGICFNKK